LGSASLHQPRPDRQEVIHPRGSRRGSQVQTVAQAPTPVFESIAVHRPALLEPGVLVDTLSDALGHVRMGHGYTEVTSKTAAGTAAAAKPSGVRFGATPT
jgi:hypothetical protein